MNESQKNEPSGGRVGHNISPDGLLGVSRKHARRAVYGRHHLRTTLNISDHIWEAHLVRDDHRHSKLIGDSQQSSQEAGEVHLASRKLT